MRSTHTQDIHVEHIGAITKTTPPYLDTRINPAHLLIDRDAPHLSLLDPDKILSDNKKRPAYVEKQYHCNVQHYLDEDNRTHTITHYFKLGKGTFGTVWLGQDQNTSQWLAVKVPFTLTEKTKEAIEKEKDNLKENLVFFDPQTGCIGMELLKGLQLYQAIVIIDNDNVSPQHVSLLQLLYLTKKLLKRTADFHKDVNALKAAKPSDKPVPLIHCDLKSLNVLVNLPDHDIALCDVSTVSPLMITQTPQSTSSFVTDPIIMDMIKTQQEEVALADKKPTKGTAYDVRLLGTNMFIAPELLVSGEKPYTEASEVYALGMTIAEMLNIAKLSHHTMPYTVDHRRVSSIYRYQIDDTASSVPQMIVDFVKRMVHPYPSERPTLLESAIFFNSAFAEESRKHGLKTLVIAVDHFLSLKKFEKTTLIKKIIQKKINAIVLEQSDATLNQDFYQARHELAEAKIYNVASFMLKGSHDDVLAFVKNHYDQQFATVHTQVYTYQDEHLIEATPTIPPQALKGPVETIEEITTPSLTDAQIEKIKTVFTPAILRGLEKALHYAKDEEEETRLDDLKDDCEVNHLDDFRACIGQLELAYHRSLKNRTPFLRGTPAALAAMTADHQKYHVCRILGILLKSSYALIDQLGLPFHKMFPDVINIQAITPQQDFSSLAFDVACSSPTKAAHPPF